MSLLTVLEVGDCAPVFTTASPTVMLEQGTAHVMVLLPVGSMGVLSPKYMNGVVMVMMPFCWMPEGGMKTMKTPPNVALFPTVVR